MSRRSQLLPTRTAAARAQRSRGDARPLLDSSGSCSSSAALPSHRVVCLPALCLAVAVSRLSNCRSLPTGAFPSPAVSLPGGAPTGNATAGNATSPANATAPAATFTTRGLRARLFQAVANDTAGANATANATAAAEFSRAGIRWADLLFDGGVIHVSPHSARRGAA